MIPYGAVQSVCPTCKHGIGIRRNSERYHIPSPTGGAFEFREYVCSLHRHEITDSHAGGLSIFCSGQQRRNFSERHRGRRSRFPESCRHESHHFGAEHIAVPLQHIFRHVIGRKVPAIIHEAVTAIYIAIEPCLQKHGKLTPGSSGPGSEV